MTNKQIQGSEFLHAVRGLIDRPNKWIKGSLISNESHCILGAMGVTYWSPRYAGRRDGLEWAAMYEKVDATLRSLTDTGGLASFNDADSTSHDDIMLLVDSAIGILQAEGD